MSFSNTVFSSTVTRDASIVAPAASRALLGCSGEDRLTNFAPKAVFDVIATSTFDGIDSSASGSIDNDSCAVASSVGVMDSTEPTVTPAIFTRAPGSITSPARSAITVIGTRATNTWLKDATDKAMTPTIAAAKPRAANL